MTGVQTCALPILALLLAGLAVSFVHAEDIVGFDAAGSAAERQLEAHVVGLGGFDGLAGVEKLERAVAHGEWPVEHAGGQQSDESDQAQRSVLPLFWRQGQRRIPAVGRYR